jgi:4-alpha-glucanotransferase
VVEVATDMHDSLLNHLAWLRGVGEAYYDYRGELKPFGVETRTAILSAMGCNVSDTDALAHEIASCDASYWCALLPSVAVTREGRRGLPLSIPADRLDCNVEWRLRLSNGSELRGEVRAADLVEKARQAIDGCLMTRRELTLPESIPLGYHDLHASLETGEAGQCTLISAPSRSHEPPVLTAGGRLWGLSIQLYTLRSEANWGIGDFADLESVVRRSAELGASFVGLNPLHALFPTDPSHCSPYSPSSRHFLNTLYIAVSAIPEFDASPEAQACVANAAFRSELQRLRELPLIDYAGVAQLKFPLLRLLHARFGRDHLACETPRGRKFLEYRSDRGEPLRLHALHDAIAEHLCAGGLCAPGWQSWPEPYRNPFSPEVLAFEAEHADDVEFHAWLQWVADQQLSDAQTIATELGMSIGLYGDYAVSVNASGSETWADQDVYCLGAGVGAPPDPLALMGQDWGIPPLDPQKLKQRRYRPFQSLLSDNMRRVGALRLDHVMSLFRQWWVPAGRGATDGVYVHYPLDDLMSVLALESESHRCLVIGEDLGTVPDEVRDAMERFGVYHYKVLLFEKEADGSFRLPDRYVRHSIATITTHDLPTLRGFWNGTDLELRDDLQLFPSEDVRRWVLEERRHDRQHLLNALATSGLRPDKPASVDDPFDEALAHSVHLYLARSGSALAAIQIEDLIGTADPVNVPGTSREYPNWRRKLHLTVEEIFARESTAATLRDVARIRPR